MATRLGMMADMFKSRSIKMHAWGLECYGAFWGKNILLLSLNSITSEVFVCKRETLQNGASVESLHQT